MKLPKFDHDKQKWDHYKEFYVELDSGNFIQFATGELICVSHFNTRSGWGQHDSSGRGFKQIGVTTFQVNDQPEFLRTKTLHDPGRTGTVLRSWLPQAYPMLYDHSSRRVVSLQYHDKSKKQSATVPSRFWNKCGVYWAGTERLPIGGSSLRYFEQNKISPLERDDVKTKVTIIKSQLRVLGTDLESNGKYYGSGDIRVNAHDVFLTDIDKMDDDLKYRIAKFGIRAGTTMREADYLEVRDV